MVLIADTQRAFLTQDAVVVTSIFTEAIFKCSVLEKKTIKQQKICLYVFNKTSAEFRLIVHQLKTLSHVVSKL